MPINFIKKKDKNDQWFVPFGMKEKTKSHETDKGASDGPQGGPSFVSGADQPSMPGSSVGDTTNAMGGSPGTDYDASWGISVSMRRVPPVVTPPATAAPKSKSLWGSIVDWICHPLC